MHVDSFMSHQTCFDKLCLVSMVHVGRSIWLNFYRYWNNYVNAFNQSERLTPLFQIAVAWWTHVSQLAFCVCLGSHSDRLKHCYHSTEAIQELKTTFIGQVCLTKEENKKVSRFPEPCPGWFFWYVDIFCVCHS